MWVATLAAIGGFIAQAQVSNKSPAPVMDTAQQGTAVAAQLQVALNALQGAMSGIDIDQLHISDKQKQAVSDSQTSIQRNLTDALPSLLAAYRTAPGNLGAAFRLYRDVDAVLLVAQQSAAMMSSRDGDQRDTLDSSTSDLQTALKRLGDWIQTQGNADYAARKPHTARDGPRDRKDAPGASAATSSAQSPSGADSQPATLVISNANGGDTNPAPKKKPAPTIPH